MKFVTDKAPRVVTHGLYSRIRSPIYLFGGLAVAGFFLDINQPLALWLFVVLIPPYLIYLEKLNRRFAI